MVRIGNDGRIIRDDRPQPGPGQIGNDGRIIRAPPPPLYRPPPESGPRSRQEQWAFDINTTEALAKRERAVKIKRTGLTIAGGVMAGIAAAIGGMGMAALTGAATGGIGLAVIGSIKNRDSIGDHTGIGIAGALFGAFLGMFERGFTLNYDFITTGIVSGIVGAIPFGLLGLAGGLRGIPKGLLLSAAVGIISSTAGFAIDDIGRIFAVCTGITAGGVFCHFMGKSLIRS